MIIVVNAEINEIKTINNNEVESNEVIRAIIKIMFPKIQKFGIFFATISPANVTM